MEIDLSELSDPFRGMLAQLATVSTREEIQLSQIPSPKGIAPQALAIAAEVDHDISSDHGVSRLVFCWDASVPEGWNSEFRIIGYAKSPIETEMAKDDYLSALPWEWLKDSLTSNGAQFAHEAGTTTTVLSTGHGSLITQPQHAEIEIRASWAPVNFDLTPHLIGWVELLALISGLPPKDAKVVRLG